MWYQCNNNTTPVMYDSINMYNASLSPSTMHVKNTAIEQYFCRYLLQKTMSVFKWEVPENWDLDYFQYALFCYGVVAVINTDKFGVIPQHCGLQGYNVYYRPSEVVVSNPLLSGINVLKIGVNCEIFKCTSDYGGIMDLVSRYASEMALTLEAFDVNVANSRLAYVFGAKSRTGAESMKKILDKIMAGDTAVFYDDRLRRSVKDGSTEEPWTTFTNDLRSNFIAPDLLDTMRRLEEMFCNEIGLPNTRSDKKERMISSEAESNNVEAFSRAEMWLEGWKDTCDRVKRMFGIDVSVDWRNDPKKLSDETGGVDYESADNAESQSNVL